jgi:hypothetical protein
MQNIWDVERLQRWVFRNVTEVRNIFGELKEYIDSIHFNPNQINGDWNLLFELNNALECLQSIKFNIKNNAIINSVQVENTLLPEINRCINKVEVNIRKVLFSNKYMDNLIHESLAAKINDVEKSLRDYLLTNKISCVYQYDNRPVHSVMLVYDVSLSYFRRSREVYILISTYTDDFGVYCNIFNSVKIPGFVALGDKVDDCVKYVNYKINILC